MVNMNTKLQPSKPSELHLIDTLKKPHLWTLYIADQAFIRSNEMFKGVTRKAKCEGRGEIDSKPQIEDEDMEKIADYFKKNLEGPPNPSKLREIVLFNIIYYMGRRGHQNLRTMTKDTFAIGCDADGTLFIYQAVKEQDKNQTEADLNPSNEARIYEMSGLQL